MRKGILHIEEYFGDCNALQHITLHFSALQLIAVLLAESERERMWQSSHRLIRLCPALFFYFLLLSSIKLKPKNFRDALTKEWFSRFWISIVFRVSEILPCPSDLWGLSWDDICFFLPSSTFSKFRRFQKYLQYIGADCIRSVSLGSSFFRRLWPLMLMLMRKW